MREDTGLTVQSEGQVIAPTTSTRGRKSGGLSKAAKAAQRQEAAAASGFNAKVEEVRMTATAIENFAAELEDAAVAYQLDVLDSIVPNVRARVMEGVQSSDSATFLESNDAWAASLREASKSSQFFTDYEV